ncbi:MAG: type I DNA topoisomerase [Armatimonadetes bacterium]|nr:type I DNA topoisomerase [Armatimonadota bacterium]
MPKTLVIVESPAKARTIGQFLGDGYDVKASYGHVRDLPESSDDIPAEFKKQKWAKLGVNTDSEFEPLYIVPADKKRRVSELKDAAKGATRLLLATDEDREGESISWHVLQVLNPKKATEVARIVFHEITPEAIDHALANPRQVDMALVRAQETRRILDRLYGYTLSPLLWKKVGPKLSAGRVQSVATRLIVLRERERRDFVVAGYCGVTAKLKAAKGEADFSLESVGGQSVADGGSFGSDGKLAKKHLWLKHPEVDTKAAVLGKSEPWKVTKVEKKPGVENPPPPFMTSTLQQEAVRKLGLTARQAMQVAQQLYEGIDIGGGPVGLITYMRTDSLNLADRAVEEARSYIQGKFGKEYLPKSSPRFKNKSKNAQEAHEAIRPTDMSREPAAIRTRLTNDQFRLYDLIWKRTLASQMEQARVERSRIEVTVSAEGAPHIFAATGKTILFPGFLRVYVEGTDDPDAELGEREKVLPEIRDGEVLACQGVGVTDHETRPPARYTEATLVRKLEDEGVGRPSTYAAIIGTIQDRGYVFKRKAELVPTFTAFAVTGLLEDNFGDLVDLGFTARMEDELDDIAEGSADMVAHLKKFYSGDGTSPGLVAEIDAKIKDIPFPAIALGEDIVVRIGRNGAFIQRGAGGPGNTANVPDDVAPAELNLAKAQALLEERGKGPEAIGQDAEGRSVFHKKGRFGDYLEVESDPPKRVTVPPGVAPADLSAEDLRTLLSFPRVVGKHPETGADITIAIGRFGAYLTAGEQKGNVGDWKQAATLDVAGALDALANGRSAKRAAGPTALRELGTADGVAGPVKVMDGRYGPYVTDGTTNATLPRGTAPEALTLDDAVRLIQAKAAAGPSKKKPFKRGGFKKKK